MFDSGYLYLDTRNCKADVLVHQGGTSSGKTYSILQALCDIAISEANRIITVVGQDIPNLKAGSLRDLENIINSSEELKSLLVSYNRTDRIFTFNTGSIIEFKSYANAQDAKNGKRDYAFFNEANGIKFKIYNEIALRTKIRVFIDYNPNEAFWVHEYLIGKPNVQLIISDHRHNPFLSDKVRQKIEALKDIDEELWRVYTRGLTGKIEGLIFRNWIECQEIPKDAEFICYALDFGFTNDPTALIEVYKFNSELYVNEIIYQRGLTNQDIDKLAVSLGVNKGRYVVADSSEPKSIEELYRLGWNIHGANKSQGSVNLSIDILRRYRINVTKGSVNLKKELNSYKWAVDRAGNKTNEPIDFMNHGVDALRYAALNKLMTNKSGKYVIM